MKKLIAAAVLLLPITAGAQVVWLNVDKFPDDIASTGDGWSAVRMEDPEFISHRIAADDFVLDKPTRITRIHFWSVEVGTPQIIGCDWYIYTGPPEGPPDTLVAYADAVKTPHEKTEIVNGSFGQVFLETMETDVVLEPGHYFLAFRTFQKYLPGGKNNNGALSTRFAKGTSRAWWNFDILADGTIAGPWTKLEVYNLVKDQEWAFSIEGEPAGCYADCDRSGELDIDDFICFQTLFGLGDLGADCDGSGELDVDDFICFQTAFGVGCG